MPKLCPSKSAGIQKDMESVCVSSYDFCKNFREGNCHSSQGNVHKEVLSCSKQLNTTKAKYDILEEKLFSLGSFLETSKENLPHICTSGLFHNTPKKTRRKNPVTSLGKDLATEDKLAPSVTETPKTSKKNSSIRRRLLLTTVATSGSAGDATALCRSTVISSGTSVVGNDFTNTSFDSVDTRKCEESAPVMLKTGKLTPSCRKRCLVFDKVEIPPREDERCEAVQPPTFSSRCQEDAGLSEDVWSHPLTAVTPSVSGSFQTPGSYLASRFADNLRILGSSSPTDVGELRGRPMLQYGSRLPEDAESAANQPNHQCPRLGIRKTSAREEDGDHPVEKAALGANTVKFANLSLMPALQVMHAICQQGVKTGPGPQGLEALLMSSKSDMSLTVMMPLAGLIGRKMGLERLDVLAELKDRNLRHILATILHLLSAEDLYRFGQVSDVWNEVILEDKRASRRRRAFLKEQKMRLELGTAVQVLDSQRRLSLLHRCALAPVQDQSRIPSCHTSLSGHGSVPPVKHSVKHSASKLEQFLQVAKTLLSDECLRPCPRCGHPARCQSAQGRGVCTWGDCALQFCTGCLCAYHGSKECSSWASKGCSRKAALPGGPQSKHSLRRL